MTLSHGPPTIRIASRAEADALAQRADHVWSGVIAVVGRDDRVCLGFERFPRRLLLEVDDVPADEAPGGRFAPRAPNREHISRLITFAASLREAHGTVLCHCTGGRSRSPAAGVICMAVWSDRGAEREAAAKLFAVRPLAYPHRGMIRLADELLDRRGALVAAVEAQQPANR